MSGWNQANQLGMLKEIAWQNGNEKIDTKKEFRDFENVVKDETWKTELINAVNSDQQQVLELFNAEDLENKVRESAGMSPEVADAYRLLLSLKNWESIETYNTEVAADNFNLWEYEVALSDNIKDSAAENLSQLDASAVVTLRFWAGTDWTPVWPSADELTPANYENKLNQVKNIINNSSLKNKADLITQLDNVKADLVDINSFTNPYLHWMRCLDAIEETVKWAWNFAGTLNIEYDPNLDVAGNTQYEESERVSRAYLQIAKARPGTPWAEVPVPNEWDDIVKDPGTPENPENPEDLNNLRLTLINLINIDNTFPGSKKTITRIFERIFVECHTIREVIIKIWRKGSIEDLNNVKTIPDFFKWLNDPIHFLIEISEPISKKVSPKDIFDLTIALWYQTTEILKIMIEVNFITWKLVIDWCKKRWQKTAEVVKDVADMVFKRWKEQFNSFLIYLKTERARERELFINVLNLGWEWSWKQWNLFVDWCDGVREDVKLFWIDLVRRWEMLWSVLIEWVKSDIEKVKDMCKTLLELWLIKFNEFADWCKENWTNAQEWFIDTCKYLITEWTILFNDFGDWCKENWTNAQEWFSDVSSYLIESGKVLLRQFIERCKDAGETVRQAACNVLVWLVKAWILVVKAVVETLVTVLVIAPAVAIKMIVNAWKLVYGAGVELANFISEAAIYLWEGAKELWITFAEWCSQVIDDLGEWFWDICMSLIEKWKIAFNEFVDWCTSNWDKAKLWFESVSTRLLLNLTITVENFVDRCKWARETVKEVACNILVWLEKAGKVALNVIYNALIVIPWVTAAIAIKLLVDAWKAIYGAALDVASFIWNLAVSLWEGAVALWTTFAEWCRENMIAFGEWFWDVCQYLVEQWKLWVQTLINWCTENRESAKAWFWKVCEALITKWHLLAKNLVDRCKWAWETVKNVVCNVLVWLINAAKITMEVAVGLLVGIWILATEAIKLLIEAWKNVYENVADFAKKIVVAWWKRAQEAWETFVTYMKWFLNTLSDLAINVWNDIASFVKGLRESFKDLKIAAVDFIKASYSWVKLKLNKTWEGVVDIFIDMKMWAKLVLKTIYDLAVAAKEKLDNFVVFALSKVSDGIAWLVDGIGITIDAIWKALMTAWQYISDFINYVKNLWIITYENIIMWCGEIKDQIKAFFKAAIEAWAVLWSDLLAWLWNKLSDLKDILVYVYWATVEWLKNMINFIWWAVLDAWKFLLELWIAVPALIIMALKELGCILVDVTKYLVEQLVAYGKMAIWVLCDALAEVYWSTKEMISRIWQTVARFIKTSAQAVRNWIYEKTQDAVQAINAMKEYIDTWVKDICTWLYNKWLELVEIFGIISVTIDRSRSAVINWISDFYDVCKNQIQMSRYDLIKLWNDGVARAAEHLTIDID